uniref:Uncharacterized protein n=1 Tax=Anguilla anguilla TaxID=7936 RepID=A0A0E9Q2T1_ANGAN
MSCYSFSFLYLYVFFHNSMQYFVMN